MLKLVFLVFMSIGLVCFSTKLARGAIVFESATLAATPGSSGVGVGSSEFIGVRFQVSGTTTVNSIGGVFGRSSAISPVGNNSIFGAIVQLTGATDFPDTTNLSSPDVLGSALLAIPEGTHEITANLSLTLSAGYYALLFGSGQIFGATGDHFYATENNPDVGSPSFFFLNTLSSSNYQNGSIDNVRMFVNGDSTAGSVPEPSSIATFSLMALAFILRPFRRRLGGTLRR